MMDKIKNFKILVCVTMLTMLILWAQAQTITVNADNYKHLFEGAGVSIGLYMGHHFSMNATNQDKAIQWVANDCNMQYLQDYIDIYPQDNPAYFDKRAYYIKAAKQYQPDLKVSLVGNKFPDDLLHEITVGSEKFEVLNTDDTEIYNKLANWYFQLFKGFHDRGVAVEVLNVVNEPDLDRNFRKYHYGLNGNTQKAVAQIFLKTVPKLKEMLNDPAINSMGMKVPLIMGPSTISPNGCLEYVQYFKSNYPDAWKQIDIVSAHQYINGSDENRFQQITEACEGKPFYQSETHAYKGDDLGEMPIDKPLRTVLSLANLFKSAVANGVNSWFYFETNYPDEYHPGGLIRVGWNTLYPYPYKHYYAFKQLTSAQPAFSHVVENQLQYGNLSDVICFRKKNEDTIYVHFVNNASVDRDISLRIKDANGTRKIKALNVWVTDKDFNDEVTIDKTYSNTPTAVTVSVRRYSVNTLKFTLDNTATNHVDMQKQYAGIEIWNQSRCLCIDPINSELIQQVEVFDIKGRLIYQDHPSHSGPVIVDKVRLQRGLQVVRVQTLNGVMSKKVMIN